MIGCSSPCILGGQQFSSNYNTRIQYIFIQRPDDRALRGRLDENTGHPLHPNTYGIDLDRKIYGRWYASNQNLHCCPGVMANLDIVMGPVPTFYGEVESWGQNEGTILDRLDQVSARVLCYTDKCFSMYAKSNTIYFKFYQRDDDQGTVYVVTHTYHHSPVMVNVIP